MKTLTNTDPRLYKVNIYAGEDDKYGVRVIDSNGNFTEHIVSNVPYTQAELIGNAFGQLYQMDVTEYLTTNGKTDRIEDALREFCQDRLGNISIDTVEIDENIQLSLNFWSQEELLKYKTALVELVSDLSTRYQVGISIQYSFNELYVNGKFKDQVVYTTNDGKLFNDYGIAHSARVWLNNNSNLPRLREYASKHEQQFREEITSYVVSIGAGVYPETVFDQMDEDEANDIQVRIEEKLMEVK